MPRKIKVDGRTIAFPDDATNDEINEYINRARGNKQSMGGPPTKGPARVMDFIPEALSAAGGMVGAAAGAGTPLSIPASMLGAAGGREIGEGLKGKFPNTFGEPSDTPEQDAIVDAIAQGLVIPGLAKSAKFAYDTARIGPRKQIANVLSNSVMNRVSPSLRTAGAQATASQANEGLQSFDKNLLDILDEAAMDTSIHRGKRVSAIERLKGSPVSPFGQSGRALKTGRVEDALEEYNRTLGDNSIGQDLLSLNRDLANPQAGAKQYYSKIADRALSDVAEVRNFKLATGGNTKALEDLATTKLLRGATTGGNGQFDPYKILQEFDGPSKEIYEEAISKGTRDNIRNLATTLQNAQTTIAKGAESSGLLKRTGRALAIAIPSTVFGGPTAGAIVGGVNAANEVRLLVDNTLVKKFVSNPENVKLIQQAAKTKFTSPESATVGKAILGTLRGSSVYVMTPKGERHRVVVDDDGKLLPTQ